MGRFDVLASIKSVFALVLSSALTYVFAVVMITQFNLSSIQSMGIPIPFELRVLSTIRDLYGMIAVYFPAILIGLGIAFLFTRYLLNIFFRVGLLWYVAAGFVALLTIHIAIKFVTGLPIVAPTNSTIGLFSQAVAGGLGGCLFYQAYSRWASSGKLRS